MADWDSYELYEEVFVLPPNFLTRAPARRLYERRMEMKSSRVEALARLVRSDGLELSGSSADLVYLNEWFVDNLEADPDRPELLASRWYSVVSDIGLFLGEVVIERHPSLHWEFFTWGKKNRYYQQHVVMGFDAVYSDKHAWGFPNMVWDYAHRVINNWGTDWRQQPEPVTVHGIVIDPSSRPGTDSFLRWVENSEVHVAPEEPGSVVSVGVQDARPEVVRDVIDWDRYELYEVDFVLRPDSFSRVEARRLYKCRMEMIPRRLEALAQLVRSSGFELGSSDEDIQKLNEWFVRNIEADPDRPGALELAWYSVVSDIALFLSEVMIERCPSLHWAFHTWKNIDYQHHVIMGFGKVNPKFHYSLCFQGLVSRYAHSLIYDQGSIPEQKPVTVHGVVIDIAKLSARWRGRGLWAEPIVFVHWLRSGEKYS